MNKIFVNIYIPILDESYDIFIPVNKKVGTIKNAVIFSVKNLAQDSYKFVKKDDGAIIDDDVYVKNSGITNGSRLILL